MTQLTYYPPASGTGNAPEASAAWEPALDNVHTLRHGYNLADLARLARISTNCSWGTAWDRRELYEVAWSAIAEALYSAPQNQPPQPHDLIWAAQDAIGVQVRSDMRQHGYDRHNPGETMARFDAYWMNAGWSPGPEGRVIERTALWQIWPSLPPGQRSALLALAAAGTYQGAAASLGIAEKTLRNTIQAARRAFLMLWHEHEEPSAFWGSNRLVYRAATPVAAGHDGRKAMKAVRRRKSAVPRAPRAARHGTAHEYNYWKCRCSACAGYKSAESTQRRRQAGAQVRRFMTVSQLAAAVSRHDAGESWAAIAASLGFSASYLRSLRRGGATPVPDDAARTA